MPSRPKTWRSMSEALAYLARHGYDVSEPTIRSKIKQGKLRAEEAGKSSPPSFMFHVDELDRFLTEEVAAERRASA